MIARPYSDLQVTAASGKGSDKLQFVGGSRQWLIPPASDKLKFVGHQVARN